ncbi:sensor histidine kinase [Pseudemcibacter aquimaris]|uniref:sensor histidine kinase n=1 Tax=Pseudemcibacter aquimaris TaxID=2857064 RepID=UPI002011B2A8|nr:ATP-binding protein [Pseudemcibacter aquimaris]MCC3859820.1 hypothetical protein [Pseudemcibacter aquimaris]WDU60214.1 hypothetical protein KW060_08075 [Pseudemcibacter aquimaris]
MDFFLDIATITSISSFFYAILLFILCFFWRQNSDIDAIMWWCGFPLFRLVNSLISSDSIQYDNEFIIYVGNVAIVASDVLLMIGCLTFAEIKYNWKHIAGYMVAFILVCLVQLGLSAELAARTQAIVAFAIIPYCISIYAMTRLTRKCFLVEKYFAMFWMSFQLAVMGFWILIGFDFDNPAFNYGVLLSLALAYLSHIFISLALITLVIAWRRGQLKSESEIQKSLEQSLSVALEAAKKANVEKDVFLKNMSHELRTPLNGILGYSESLKLDFYGDLNEKQMEYIDHIHNGGEFLLKLITDLLHLSNIEEGKVEINSDNVNLISLVNKTLPLLNEIVGKTDVQIILENKIPSEKRSSAAIFVDQIRVSQILINLVSNSAKYGDKKSDIILAMSEVDDRFYRISVTDKGPGISQNNQDRVFRPFDRAGKDDTKIEGVGVGLSIAKQLIEDMNGSIDFISKVGVGSTFWIDVPKTEQRALRV